MLPASVHRTFKSRFKGAINLKSARPAYYLDFKSRHHWRAKEEYFRGREKRNTKGKTWTVTFRRINEDSWHWGILAKAIGRHKTSQNMYWYMLNGIRYGFEVPGFELRCGRDFPHQPKHGSRHIHSSQKWLPYFFAGERSGRGVAFNIHDFASSRLWMRRAVPLQLSPFVPSRHVPDEKKARWMYANEDNLKVNKHTFFLQ